MTRRRSFDRTSNKFGKQRKVGASLTFWALGSRAHRDRTVELSNCCTLSAVSMVELGLWRGRSRQLQGCIAAGLRTTSTGAHNSTPISAATSTLTGTAIPTSSRIPASSSALGSVGDLRRSVTTLMQELSAASIPLRALCAHGARNRTGHSGSARHAKNTLYDEVVTILRTS